MKLRDLPIILIIAFISGVFSFVISGLLFGGDDSENLTAPVVRPITADFPQLDTRYFNEQSLNPTRTITIGESTNEQPF